MLKKDCRIYEFAHCDPFGLGNGPGLTGGAGSSSLTLTELTSAVISAQTFANGGAGGRGFTSGAGGAATATTTITSANMVDVGATATGGNAGHGGGMVGGGNATAGATATSAGSSPGATATATASATGGSSGAGILGTANASAQATTASGQQAKATSTAFGNSGTAAAGATTQGSIFSNVDASASSAVPAGFLATSKGTANIAGAPVAFDNTANAYAAANGLPSSAFTSAAFASHPNVAAAFGAAGATVLGAGAQGALKNDLSLFSSGNTYHASLDWDFDTTKLSGDLLVGLLDNSLTSQGFTSLEFSITEDGSTKIDQTFTTAAAAASYFSDHVLDLGTFVAEPALDLLFDFTLYHGSSPGRFGEDFLFGAASSAPITPPPGAVPELASFSILGFGLAAALLYGRRVALPAD